MVVKRGCHCAYTNETSDNGNQKVTSECGVSFKKKSPKILLSCNLFLVHIAIGLWSRFTQKRSFLDYDVFCTNELNTQKELRKVKQV